MKFHLFPFFIMILFTSCMTAPISPAEVDVVEPEIEKNDILKVQKEDEPFTDSVIREETETLPPLSDSELLNKIDGLMPWNMVAVRDDRRPIVILHDLDKNGYKDALVVAVEGGEYTEFKLKELSKSARLFQSGQEYSNFLLLIFYQYSDEVVLRYTVPVSKQLVFNGVENIEIKTGSDFPYALLFSFRTRAGIEQELVILSGYGITRFTIRENLSEISLIDDIDEDGYKDILIHEQGFEEGTGYETFITWFKWNLREYTEYKTTNIVRNLKQFFLISSEYLRAGEHRAFLEYVLDAEVLAELKDQKLTDSEILNMIFFPAGDSNSSEDFFSEGKFSTVVFPEIMETPFSYANRMDFRHQVSIRIGRQGEPSRIFLAELNMMKNPFQNKQFCFSIDN